MYFYAIFPLATPSARLATFNYYYYVYRGAVGADGTAFAGAKHDQRPALAFETNPNSFLFLFTLTSVTVQYNA